MFYIFSGKASLEDRSHKQQNSCSGTDACVCTVCDGHTGMTFTRRVTPLKSLAETRWAEEQ